MDLLREVPGLGVTILLLPELPVLVCELSSHRTGRGPRDASPEMLPRAFKVASKVFEYLIEVPVISSESQLPEGKSGSYNLASMRNLPVVEGLG